MSRQDCRTLYKFDELSDRAKNHARDWYREDTIADNYDIEELMNSLKALFKAAGVPLADWQIGPYYQGTFLNADLGDAAELSGPRAMAWLENRLFGPLRVTYADYAEHRKEWHGYGYRPGRIKDCPLTGFIHDEDLLDALRAAVKSGDTLKKAFNGLADTVRRINEADIEALNEDQEVDESIRANEYEFLENGERP